MSLNRVKNAPAANGKHQTAADRPARIENITIPEGRTDIANGQRLVYRYGRVLRYCHPWRKWLVWDGKRWHIDNSGAVVEMMKRVVRSLWRTLSSGQDIKVTNELLLFLQKSSSKPGINNAITLAASAPGIPVQPAELDANQWLLNCENGTLDLRTGTLLQHNPANNITTLCPTPYVADAQSDVWDKFIASILPDSDVATFLQRFQGYSATGDVREQVLPVFWGGGSNGKSTYLNAVMETLGGDYAIKCDKKLIVQQKNSGHSTERMDLFGKRLALASESEDGERLAESLIKDLTGGEPIRGRRMKEDTWEYKPTHKLILATNHRPEVNGQDHALWRRLRLIPFTQTFYRPEDACDGRPQIDPHLAAKLAAVRPAILAWMVKGCLDWQEHGLPTPAAILAATKEYKVDQDRLTAFLEECCIQAPQVKIKSGSLYDAYKKWSEHSGEQPLTLSMFGRRIKERFTVTKSNGIWLNGVVLSAHHDNTA